MATQLIQLEDDVLVEVSVKEDAVQQISGSFAKRVEATLGAIKPVLLKICRNTMETVNELQKEVKLEQVEVEVGLSFDAEGNIYVAKTNVGANVLIRMTLQKTGAEVHG